jgi:hypothetical protein
MKTRTPIIVIVMALLFAGLAYAQSSGGYDLTWNTIDNGSGTLGNGGYTLDGTIGQPDTNAPSSNGGYTLTGGFWHTIAPAYPIYLPLIRRGP